MLSDWTAVLNTLHALAYCSTVSNYELRFSACGRTFDCHANATEMDSHQDTDDFVYGGDRSFHTLVHRCHVGRGLHPLWALSLRLI